MTNANKDDLIHKLATRFPHTCHSPEDSWGYGDLADFILEEHKLVVEPLVQLNFKLSGAISIKKAIDQTLSNAGMEV